MGAAHIRLQKRIRPAPITSMPRAPRTKTASGPGFLGGFTTMGTVGLAADLAGRLLEAREGAGFEAVWRVGLGVLPRD
ncbi:hypothetical protein FACS1894184_20890 [Clostridia bacterium]|nr:hypothetical protein FACS1894184_20890 [Clostridia bacterium]